MHFAKRLYRAIRLFCLKIVSVARVLQRLGQKDFGPTYFPEAPRKTQSRILFENLLWAAKYGEVNDSYFTYGFDRLAANPPDNYLPYLEFKQLRNRMNNSWSGQNAVDYRCLLRDKFVFGQFVASLGFPTPAILGACHPDGIYWLSTGKKESYTQILQHDGLDAFCKSLMGECGEGVYKISVEDQTLKLNGEQADAEELPRLISGHGIIQERIYQHQMLSTFYPGSVNTVRLTTIIKDGKPTLFASFMRFGARGNTCDNWATGGVMGGIGPTGILKETFFNKPGYGGKVTRHPETGISFEGFQIPFFQDAVDASLELHSYFYGVHSIGWDIAITETGPCFIEGNDNWEINPIQIVQGGMRERYISACSFPGLGSRSATA